MIATPSIHLVSDLHLEFQRDGGFGLCSRLPDADVLVVAGDLTTAPFLPGALKMLSCRFDRVVYVPGNHCWYGGSAARTVATKNWVTAHLSNVHWLDQNTVTLHGQRFVGCTLWYPWTDDAQRLRETLSDFYQIRDVNDWIPLAYKSDREWLKLVVKSDDIVVTHHLPSPKSIAPQYAGLASNCYFLGDCEDIIAARQPRIWCHGHTHTRFDYLIGETRVVCNPLGYPGEGANAPEDRCDIGSKVTK